MIVEVYFKRACVFVAPPTSALPSSEEEAGDITVDQIAGDAIRRIGEGEYGWSNYLGDTVFNYYMFSV